MTDVLFVSPNISSKIYQELANKYTAIEPPTWSLLLAESCRSVDLAEVDKTSARTAGEGTGNQSEECGSGET